MRTSTLYKYILILICIVITACSGTRQLPQGEKLYTGAEVEVVTIDKVNKRQIKAAAKSVIRPSPNKKFLGMRPKLWIYMAAGENPHTKLGRWFRKKGEAPVLISNVKPGVTANLIDATLFNNGIFKSYTITSYSEKKHTVKVIYTSVVHKPFTIDSISYDFPDDSLTSLLVAEKDKSLLKHGDNYDLDIIKNERARIDAILKNIGYFHFSPDFILFKADTSATDRTISFRLVLKDDIPENALTVYRINKVFIDLDYTLNEESSDSPRDSTIIKDNIFDGTLSEMKFRPKVILNSVYLKKGELYSRTNHNKTLNRLMLMGNFKFVQVKFSKSDTTAANFLDVRILLTPVPDRTVRTEIDLVTKSNNYTGPRVNLSLLNRNTFRGAEQLNLNLAGSFEAQLSGKDRNLYSYSINPQIELIFPRFVLPFNLENTRSYYIPKTSFSLSFNYLKKVNYFDMRTFQFIYGFKWKENIKKEHEFNPINVSYTSIGNESTAFRDLLDSIPFLKKSYEELFIAGTNYSFSYNEQLVAVKKMQYFLKLTAETAGNGFSLAKRMDGENPSPQAPSTVLGSVYSQFAKFSADIRGYYNFRDNNKIAMRFFTGLARPYGNSDVLPYIKQFFSGGPNSLRAFQINSVGPGTFFQDQDNRSFLQLGGEIKLEMNAEYRFNIYRYFKGALFIDAGNVWLQKSNPANIGDPFSFSGFMNELAVGTGIGIRIDVSFFLLRFDLATPLRKPWLPDNQWVADEISFSSPKWRRDNLMLNIAIGYPF